MKKPARYSAAGLIKRGITGESWPRAWRDHELRSSYDVVIIGAGVHGLAAAYYLAANHGITNVAVLDKGYVGGGGSGRNTAIVRSNYLTPEGVAFYDRSLDLYNTMAADLNINVMFSERGHLTLAHTDGALRTMRWRAEVNKLQGIDSSVIGPDEIKALTPSLDTSPNTRYPILGALYHPPGGTIRHDAVNWGYARAADTLGVQIHQNTEVTDIIVRGGDGGDRGDGSGGGDGKGPGGRVTGVRTTRGDIATPIVLNATAGWASLIAAMAGVRLPITTHPLQAAVTEPVKVFLPTVVVSGSLHVYVSQTDRGELVFGASVDPFATYDMRGSLDFTEELAGHVLELMPGISPDAAAASVGRAVRHDPRLLAGDGLHPRRGIPVRRRLGNLRIQGRTGVGRADGRMHRHRRNAETHRPVQPRPVRRRAAGRREGRSRRRPLTAPSARSLSRSHPRSPGPPERTPSDHVARTVPPLRAPQRRRPPLRRRDNGPPRSHRRRTRSVARLPLSS